MKEEDLTKEKWNNGEYACYVEWMEASIRVHKKYGLDKKFFEKVMDSIDYHPGVKETFEELREKGYKTALISGGFKAQADRALKDLKINHAFAPHANIYGMKKGTLPAGTCFPAIMRENWISWTSY